jgi:hypothetical protein
MSTLDSGGCDEELLISIGDLIALSGCIGGSWEEDALATLLGGSMLRQWGVRSRL